MTKGINESVDQASAKYNILASFEVNGVVEVQDVVGALFGQTEGLLNDLELRELQKSGRIGRIVVNSKSENGITSGEIIIPSSLDRTETAILAATLETVDRVGPCRAKLHLQEIKDLRESKLRQIEARAKELLKDWKAGSTDKENITEKIQEDLERESIIRWKGLPAGSEIDLTDRVIIVEGRNDIQQLLKIGVKNTIAVNGTSIPKAIIDLTNTKECTAFVDGDRGGEMILNELLQVSKIKYYARAPLNREVEELAPKELVKCLQQKRPVADLLKERKSKEIKDREIQKTRKKSTSSYKSRDSKDYKDSHDTRDSSRDHRDSRERRPNGRYDSRTGPSSRSRNRPQQNVAELFPPQVKELVKGLISSNEAIILDEQYNEIHKTGNVKIFDEIKDNSNVIVMDGVVSQRFVDRAIEKHVKKIIAVNINRKLDLPEKIDLELYYFKDFL